MRALLIVLVLSTCGSGCAARFDATFHRVHYASEGLALASLACDGGSTVQFLRESTWIETNPILGEHPSDAAVWTYLGSVGVALAIADHFLPDRWAVALDTAVLGAEIYSISFNSYVGASPCGIGDGGPWRP